MVAARSIALLVRFACEPVPFGAVGSRHGVYATNAREALSRADELVGP